MHFPVHSPPPPPLAAHLRVGVPLREGEREREIKSGCVLLSICIHFSELVRTIHFTISTDATPCDVKNAGHTMFLWCTHTGS